MITSFASASTLSRVDFYSRLQKNILRRQREDIETNQDFRKYMQCRCNQSIS